MNAPAPLAYSLHRDTASDRGNGHNGESWIAHVQGLPVGHELDGSHELPADIVSGSEAHAYVQARLPGARYMSPDQRRARKYRGAYPAKIRELFHAGALYVVTCNSGARYSIPAGAGLPVPAIGHCVRAFERTDWTGATHPAETDTTGATLPASEVEALEALYLETRRDLPCPVEAAARVAGKAFVTSPRYNVFNVRDGAGATVATRATLYGPDGAQVMAETMNRRAAERASSETERLERLERNRAARLDSDLVSNVPDYGQDVPAASRFAFVVYAAPGYAALCEGGVYSDKPQGDYSGNTLEAAALEAETYNSRYGRTEGRYEVRESLAGVTVDSEVRESLEAWQIAALAPVSLPVSQDGPDFYVGDSDGTQFYATAPLQVRDFDLQAAARARDWFVTKWAPAHHVSPIFA